MNPAKLGGVHGAGEVISRPSPNGRSYRGSFAFRESDASAIVNLFSTRKRVYYEGVVDQNLAAVNVTIASVSLPTGIAYLEA